MPDSVADLAREFDLSGRRPFNGRSFNEIHQRIDSLKASHYNQYIPTLGSEHPDFEQRLYDWIINTPDDEDRRLLLELTPKIAFISREEMTKLKQAALRGPICQWLVDELGLQFSDTSFESRISEELEHHTWFTSITDSMQISEFHHANRLGGIDHRPDWRSLSQFGDVAKISRYMDQHVDQRVPRQIRRIVILEDFVGSGTQMEMGTGSVDFAARNFPDKSILLVPLIICPEGANIARTLAGRYENLTFCPVLELSQDELIASVTVFEDRSLEQAIKELCGKLYDRVRGGTPTDLRPYSPWGFRETGSLVVLYTNTPANTLPIIQHQSESWNPLFPRSARVR